MEREYCGYDISVDADLMAMRKNAIDIIDCSSKLIDGYKESAVDCQQLEESLHDRKAKFFIEKEYCHQLEEEKMLETEFQLALDKIKSISGEFFPLLQKYQAIKRAVDASHASHRLAFIEKQLPKIEESIVALKKNMAYYVERINELGLEVDQSTDLLFSSLLLPEEKIPN